MDALGTILLIALICAAVLPLLTLVVYAAASALGLSFADRILATTMALLAGQWSLGGVLSIITGAALIALGIWCVLNFQSVPARALGLVLLLFGVWRLGRGVSILRTAARSAKRN